MTSLTLEMIRKRAEHNDGILHSLEELSLNQMGLVGLGLVAEVGQEKDRGSLRSLLPRACRRLRHLSLAGNALPRLPCGSRDLGLLKELRTLNVSLNAIEVIRNEETDDDGDGGPLSSFESLVRLDLSGNFISKATARETALSLSSAPVLESLWLAGCPVAVEWGESYRAFFVASLPRLKELDGISITAIERIEALEKLPELQGELLEAEKEKKEDDEDNDASSIFSSAAELAELEEEADSLEKEMREKGDDAPMPWSRAARLVLARETAAAAVEKEKKKKTAEPKGSNDDKTSSSSLFGGSSRIAQPPRTSMPPWSSSDDDDSSSDGDDGGGERRRIRRQCDDGAWPFALFPSSRDSRSPHLVLEVALGTRVAPSDVQLVVRRRHVRVLASGSLLCVRLPAAVVPSRATAKRSHASGKLVVGMPLEDPESEIDESCVREWTKKKRESAGQETTTTMKTTRAFAAAARVVVVASDDDESDDTLSPPPL